MHHGNHPQRAFIRRIGNELLPDNRKAQRTGCEVGPSVCLMRKEHQTVESLTNIHNYTVGGSDVIGGYIFPNLIEIDFGFRGGNRNRS